VTAGLITPDDELERVIRAKIGAGDLPEDAQRSAVSRIPTYSGGVSALAETLIKRRRNG